MSRRSRDLYARVEAGKFDENLLGAGVISLWGGPVGLALANARTIGRELDPSFLGERAIRRDPDAPPIVPVSVLPPDDRERLGLYEDDGETVVMLVEPPEPLGLLSRLISPDGVPIQAKMRGTLGPCIAHSSLHRGFLTAGHVAGEPGGGVDRLRVRRLRRTRHDHFATVLRSVDPVDAGRPGYDVALLRPEGRMPRLVPQGIARLDPEQLVQPEDTTLVGGVSGRRHGFVQGALAALRDGSGARCWTNAWMMFPGSIGAQGDSGGAVVTPGGEVLGLLVGGSRVRGTTAFAVLYVQDLEAIERDVLDDPEWLSGT